MVYAGYFSLIKVRRREKFSSSVEYLYKLDRVKRTQTQNDKSADNNNIKIKCNKKYRPLTNFTVHTQHK